ncbi:MAG: hypothetical protein KKE69_07915 [Alphaproteobacteria bacterium]|nr:hypothetical protein [Alphaproteobacteria bacterium]MBU1606876.1 hypothetical protein [Alphaproteobacteria bacterium]
MTGLRNRLRAVERSVGRNDEPERPDDLPGHVTVGVRDQAGWVVCWLQPSTLDASL